MLDWKKFATKRYQILSLPQPTLLTCFQLYYENAKPSLGDSHWKRRYFSLFSGETPENLTALIMIHRCTYQEMTQGRQQNLSPKWSLKAESSGFIPKFFTFMFSVLFTLETSSETTTHSLVITHWGVWPKFRKKLQNGSSTRSDVTVGPWGELVRSCLERFFQVCWISEHNEKQKRRMAVQGHRAPFNLLSLGGGRPCSFTTFMGTFPPVVIKHMSGALQGGTVFPHYFNSNLCPRVWPNTKYYLSRTNS